MKQKTYERIKISTCLVTVYFGWGTIAFGFLLCGYALVTLECLWALLGIFCLVISCVPYITLYNGIISDRSLFNIDDDEQVHMTGNQS